MKEKTAYIAIVGRANTGKSSLLNAILGCKVAIVSSKPQTTRTRITGIYTKGELQLVFLDTPGFHVPKTRLGDFMIKTIEESVCGVDMCLLVTEAGKLPGPPELELVKRFRAHKVPVALVLNKMDLARDAELVSEQIAAYTAAYDFAAVLPTAASLNEGIDELLRLLAAHAQPGKHLFSADIVTDMTERTMVAEIIREKLLRLLDKEIPHGIAVEIERMSERENGGITDIGAVIVCEKASHKGIIIGKGGQMLKKAATYAREDIEAFFGVKVNLEIWVKVRPNWRQSPKSAEGCY